MSDDPALIERLRAGDEAALTQLVRCNHARLVRLARAFCRGCRATAEEVVQDSWLAVMSGFGRYTGEARLGAWIAGIVVNKARTRASRDARLLPFTALAQAELDGSKSEPDAGALGPDGRWTIRVDPWHAVTPERLVADRELLQHLLAAIETLPPAQRAVLLLRDIEGHDGAEVSQALGLTEGNVRVLLHRARSRLFAALDPPLRTTYQPWGRSRPERDRAPIAESAAGP